MSKDYAKTRESRRRGRSANNTKAKSNFTWLIVGLVMGIIIAGLSFLKHRVTATVHPEKRLIIDESLKGKGHKSKSAKVKESEPEEDKVNFDFYTILPNVKVKSPEEGIPTATSKPPRPVNETPTVSRDTQAKIENTVTPKEVKSMEQNLLSPTRAVKIESSLLKPVILDSAAKSTTIPPLEKVVVKPSAIKAKNAEVEPKSSATKTETHEAAKAAHMAKEKESQAARARNIKELNARLAQEDQKSDVPVVDLTDAKRLTKAPVLNTAYIVQIAAFKHFEDADRLKAQLTLAGYEAKIKVVPVSGVTWHRVWLGPYPTAQAAQKLQQELLTKHTKSVVVKVK